MSGAAGQTAVKSGCQGVHRRVAIFLPEAPSPAVSPAHKNSAVSDGFIIVISTGNREQRRRLSFPQVVGGTLNQHVCLSSERWRGFFYCERCVSLAQQRPPDWILFGSDPCIRNSWMVKAKRSCQRQPPRLFPVYLILPAWVYLLALADWIIRSCDEQKFLSLVNNKQNVMG